MSETNHIEFIRQLILDSNFNPKLEMVAQFVLEHLGE